MTSEPAWYDALAGCRSWPWAAYLASFLRGKLGLILRILAVEDDRKLGSILRGGLKEHGFSVDLAVNGKSGLELALSTEYDVIMLDVLLPHQSGFDVLRELRKRNDGVPILMLTALSSVEDRVRGLDLGADDYLVKPFDFEELLARLRSIARRPRVPPLTLLRVADLVLDPAHHKVRRGRQTIDLTPREFSLLEYLMRNKGRIVTRGMILDRVWAIDHGGNANLVEVYINSLRRKVDQDFKLKLIHTARGTGYIMGDSE